MRGPHGTGDGVRVDEPAVRPRAGTSQLPLTIPFVLYGLFR